VVVVTVMVMVPPGAVPKTVSWPPRVVVVVRLVVVRVGAGHFIDPLLRVHARCDFVVVVVVLDNLGRGYLPLYDAGRFLPINSAFIVLSFVVTGTVVVRGDRRGGEQEC
jgi:hypothetical protein